MTYICFSQPSLPCTFSVLIYGGITPVIYRYMTYPMHVPFYLSCTCFCFFSELEHLVNETSLNDLVKEI